MEITPESSYANPLTSTTAAISERRYDRGAIIRDVFIIMALTGFAWILLNLTTSDAVKNFNPREYENDLAIANVVAVILGFTLSAILARKNRWRHLLVVALIVWCFTLINILLLNYPIITWLFMLPVLLILMFVGGMLSYLVNRPAMDSERRYNQIVIVRDVVLIIALAVSGLLWQRESTPDIVKLFNPPSIQKNLLLLNLITLSLGFTISGSLARQNRWQHMSLVGICVWFLSLIFIWITDSAFWIWFSTFSLLAMYMGIGGVVSYFFNRSQAESARETIIRDVVITLALGHLVSYLLIFSTSNLWSGQQEDALRLGMFSLLVTTIGLTISASLAKQNRWRHLLTVTAVIWLFQNGTSLLYGFVHNEVSTAGLYIFSTFCLYTFAMIIAGALSYIFNRPHWE